MMIYAENECVSTPFKTIYYDSSAVCIILSPSLKFSYRLQNAQNTTKITLTYYFLRPRPKQWLTRSGLT